MATAHINARKNLESDPRIPDNGEEECSDDRRAKHVAEVYGATTKSDTSHVTTGVGKHGNNRSHFRAHRHMNQVAEDGQIAHGARLIQLQHYSKGEEQPWAEGVSPTMTCRNDYCADKSSYKDVIRTLAKANNLAGVLGHFEAMQTQGFTPDMNTYLTVCEVLGRAGRMEEASRIHETMKKRFIDDILDALV